MTERELDSLAIHIDEQQQPWSVDGRKLSRTFVQVLKLPVSRSRSFGLCLTFSWITANPARGGLQLLIESAHLRQNSLSSQWNSSLSLRSGFLFLWVSLLFAQKGSLFVLQKPVVFKEQVVISTKDFEFKERFSCGGTKLAFHEISVSLMSHRIGLRLFLAFEFTSLHSRSPLHGKKREERRKHGGQRIDLTLIELATRGVLLQRF